jgi:hypothetical protein
MRHQAVIARPPRPPFAKRLCVYLWLRTAVPCASSSRSTSHVRSTGKQRAAAVQHEDTACTIDALQPPWAMPMAPAATPSPQASATKVAASSSEHPVAAYGVQAGVVRMSLLSHAMHRASHGQILPYYYRTSLFDLIVHLCSHFVQRLPEPTTRRPTERRTGTDRGRDTETRPDEPRTSETAKK